MPRAAGAALAFLLVAAAPQQATPRCSIEYEADARMTELIKREGFNFDGYDRLCPILAAKGLALDITSSDGVLEDRGYGWVSVAFIRVKTQVAGRNGRFSTSLSRDASSPGSAGAMLKALYSTLARFADDPAPYIASVEKEEARLRQALATRP